jgi:hypothetical protein
MTDTFMKTFLAIVTTLLIIFLIALTGFGVYQADNWWFLPIHESTDARVTGGCFVPRHDILAGKTIMVIPDTWYVYVHINNVGDDSVSVYQSYYDTVTNNTPVTVTYKIGRLNHAVSIQYLWSN